MKITGIVITKNEEKNITSCLDSINFLDEIIVVDSGSTDNTIELAKKLTGKIYTPPIENVTQKRKYSLEISSNDWIIFIDADERISPELKNEIASLQNSSREAFVSGYYINRKNYYFGKWVKHCGIYPDYHIRLFNRKNSEITDRIVHEGIIVKGETARLDSPILHYTVDDMAHLIRKIDYYSTMQSIEYFGKKKKVSKTILVGKAISAFLRVYISRGGFKDGFRGFLVSLSDSLVNFLTNLKLLKLYNKI
jgi:glycosyltransferase involved in cell wall biosynthesis